MIKYFIIMFLLLSGCAKEATAPLKPEEYVERVQAYSVDFDWGDLSRGERGIYETAIINAVADVHPTPCEIDILSMKEEDWLQIVFKLEVEGQCYSYFYDMTTCLGQLIKDE